MQVVGRHVGKLLEFRVGLGQFPRLVRQFDFLVFALRNVRLNPDEMREPSPRVPYRRDVEFVPKQAAVLAIIAEFRFGLGALPDRLANSVDAGLLMVRPLEEPAISTEHFFRGVACNFFKRGVAIDRGHVGLAGIGNENTVRRRIDRADAQNQFLLVGFACILGLLPLLDFPFESAAGGHDLPGQDQAQENDQQSDDRFASQEIDDILTGMGAEQFEHGVGIELKFMVELIEYGKRVRRREVIGVFEQQGAGLGKKSFKQGTLLLQKFPYLAGRGRGNRAPFVGERVQDHLPPVVQGNGCMQQRLLRLLKIRPNPMGRQQHFIEVPLNHHPLAARHVHHHHVEFECFHRGMRKSQDGAQRQNENDHHDEQALPDGQWKRNPRSGRCIHHSLSPDATLRPFRSRGKFCTVARDTKFV